MKDVSKTCLKRLVYVGRRLNTQKTFVGKLLKSPLKRNVFNTYLGQTQHTKDVPKSCKIKTLFMGQLLRHSYNVHKTSHSQFNIYFNRDVFL